SFTLTAEGHRRTSNRWRTSGLPARGCSVRRDAPVSEISRPGAADAENKLIYRVFTVRKVSVRCRRELLRWALLAPTRPKEGCFLDAQDTRGARSSRDDPRRRRRRGRAAAVGDDLALASERRLRRQRHAVGQGL